MLDCHKATLQGARHNCEQVRPRLSNVRRSVGTPARRGRGIRQATSCKSDSKKGFRLRAILGRSLKISRDAVVLAHRCRMTLMEPAQHLDPRLPH